ncbi:hypothetical protein GCM10020000_26270 [Streptomyces olivoverticillatus]
MGPVSGSMARCTTCITGSVSGTAARWTARRSAPGEAPTRKARSSSSAPRASCPPGAGPVRAGWSGSSHPAAPCTTVRPGPDSSRAQVPSASPVGSSSGTGRAPGPGGGP